MAVTHSCYKFVTVSLLNLLLVAEKVLLCPRAVVRRLVLCALGAGRKRVGAAARVRERRFAVPSALLAKWFCPITVRMGIVLVQLYNDD